MAFQKIFESLTWDQAREQIYHSTAAEVSAALRKKNLSFIDFAALISPAALPFIDQMAIRSRALTRQRFGKTIQMFAPMYLSNECNNICTYCGYSFDNKIKRRTLTDKEITEEAAAIKQMGFDHVLLVTGEANATVHTKFFLNAVELLRDTFSNISVEVQPLETDEYRKLHEAGVYSVLVYQETYNTGIYAKVHPKGKKSNFQYRLQTPERAAAAGMHKVGLGVLLGLTDWRTDSLFCAAHLAYMQKNYWRTKYSVSFPRVRPHETIHEIEVQNISDAEMLQLMLAYRLCFADAELSVSTRETEQFRNAVISLGATSMSAGSKTNPGGYRVDPQSLEQFEIEDQRTPEEFSRVIQEQGYEPVWKDWDVSFHQSHVKR